MDVKLTTKQIENLLSQEEYSPVDRMDKSLLTAEQRYEVSILENVTSFGLASITLFEDMVNERQSLPSQAEYVEAGMPLMVAHLQEHRPDIVITETAEQALTIRMTRTYMSKVIEMHLEAILKEYMPEMKVKTYALLDSVMGVDLVLEDDKKRYYVHVTSNTPFAQKMLGQKEGRGGHRVGNTYIKYSRDFTGDLILRYDTFNESDTTQMVNGFPLFKPDFIVERFFIAKRQSAIGESLSVSYSKLDHFTDWAKTYVGVEI